MGGRILIFLIMKCIAFERFSYQMFFLFYFFVVQVENSSTFAPALKGTLKNVVKEI